MSCLQEKNKQWQQQQQTKETPALKEYNPGWIVFIFPFDYKKVQTFLWAPEGMMGLGTVPIVPNG